MDTIFALSSGRPPAAIAIVRISGPKAGEALTALSGSLPEPRHASLRQLKDRKGGVLDSALVLWFPGHATATGEDLAELHLHGGLAVVRAVEEELAKLDGLRAAQPGEFTRRAFANGRIDLAEAEGLADLLEAETELQRRNAMALVGGAFSRQVEGWREQVLSLSAEVESALDFSDEDDVGEADIDFGAKSRNLVDELSAWLARPSAERLKEGYRVVLAGPPNAGKSSLFNALIDDEAAIATPIPGTTRDVLERPVSISGVPFTFVDTAGLRDDGDDPIERIGIERARAEAARADLILWLGDEGLGPDRAVEVETKIDIAGGRAKSNAEFRVSSTTGEGIDALRTALVERAMRSMPHPGELAIHRRQREILGEAHEALSSLGQQQDLLLVAELLRQARIAFDRLIGRASTEDMLDALFGRFCIGK
ncbi:tRNA uridine-5-carboxymethylaminomethyl(34) synthesis GTPase MnmE [Erythrobacter sp. HKB08]|uniref:tRNA uridine-5-carboxymethylaminomethyl(34) synthesis GTPase MnmE n=1 Tax=Erythrobacter sp. HKB08 TaxID=2502843 RepID=UPI0010086A53|nr:tRNA uridine-5-carboxymethylaminomethyl(34) synthesis GTPase MnmE [Erythrobacter sp. HKB08]